MSTKTRPSFPHRRSLTSALETLPRVMLCFALALAGCGSPEIESAPAGAGSAPVARAAAGEPADLIAILGNPNGLERTRDLSIALMRGGPEIVTEIRYALQSTRIDRGPVQDELLVRRWADFDPATAYQWALQKAPRGYRDSVVMAAIERWAEMDPQAAAAEFSQLSQGPTYEAAIRTLVAGWYRSKEPGLLDYIYDIGYGFDRQRAVSAYLRAMVQQDGPEAAMRFARELSEEDERFKRTVIRQAASELTMEDPQLGVAWEDEFGDGKYGDSILGLVVSRWVLQDGPSALAWLSKAEPGKRRELALRDGFRIWVQRDRAGALAWAAEMGVEGVEPWFRPAVGMVAMARAVLDPPEAMRWAELIEDPTKRRGAQVTIARRWRSKDPEAAERWVASSSLPPELREKTLKPLPVKRSSRPYFQKLPPAEG